MAVPPVGLTLQFAAWSAQEFVDTELGAQCVCLKYVRTDAAEMAVPPNRIVELIDVIAHVLNR